MERCYGEVLRRWVKAVVALPPMRWRSCLPQRFLPSARATNPQGIDVEAIVPKRETMDYFFYETAIGKITICAHGGAITGLYFNYRQFPDAKNVESPIIRKAFTQLNEYLEGARRNFNLKLVYGGSDFQTSVWDRLKKIPYGETKSYKEIARAVNNPKSSLAVGNACGKNPISIFIPCHRVVGSDGKLTGYGGGVSLKKKLLEMEKSNTNRKK